MNVQDAPHRRLGDPCCGAARQPETPCCRTGEAGGKTKREDLPDAHEEREGLSLGVQGPQGAERQQLVLVGATVPSASEEKGDTSG